MSKPLHKKTNVWSGPLQERWRDAQVAEDMPKGGDFDVKKEIHQLNQKFSLILEYFEMTDNYKISEEDNVASSDSMKL